MRRRGGGGGKRLLVIICKEKRRTIKGGSDKKGRLPGEKKRLKKERQRHGLLFVLMAKGRKELQLIAASSRGKRKKKGVEGKEKSGTLSSCCKRGGKEGE